MTSAETRGAGRERALLDGARGGDEDAFGRLLEPYRGELHAHCYRMLGSVHDAEDALQEALLRAWRGARALRGPQLAALVALHDRHQHLPRTRSRGGPSACCRSTTARRPTRTTGSAMPLVESVWVEPYPDETLGVEDGFAAPEARYEQRESVELAFIAALQHLPATQRAVLILREVLGFSAKRGRRDARDDASRRSTARCSARARRSTSSCPSRASRRRCARSATSSCARSSTRYMDAWQRGDVDAVVVDARRGRRVVDAAAADLVRRPRRRSAASCAIGPLSGAWRWRHLPARANGQAGARRLHLGRRGGRVPAVRARRAHARGRPDQGGHRVHHALDRAATSRTSTRAGPTSRSTARGSSFERFGLPGPARLSRPRLSARDPPRPRRARTRRGPPRAGPARPSARAR